MDQLMILPATDKSKIRLVRIPPDYENQEVYRHVTGLIAEVEEDKPGCDWEEVLATLWKTTASRPIDFQLGLNRNACRIKAGAARLKNPLALSGHLSSPRGPSPNS